MATRYTGKATPKDVTALIFRNRGTHKGISRVMAPDMARAMRRANRKDPACLRALLEDGGIDQV